MAEGFLIQAIEFAIALVKETIMALFVNWWRYQVIAHINTTVTHEKVKLVAKFDSRIPHLILSWVMVNRSNVNLQMKRIAGELFIGAWRITSFDSDRIAESHIGYTWNPLVKSQKLRLKKKGDKTEIVITVFPSLEFWFMNVSPTKCSIYNATVDVNFIGGSATTKLDVGDINIDDFVSVSSQYMDILKNTIKSKFGKL